VKVTEKEIREFNPRMVRTRPKRGSTDIFEVVGIGERGLLIKDMPDDGWRSGVTFDQVLEMW
jgi:hypothetical protein